MGNITATTGNPEGTTLGSVADVTTANHRVSLPTVRRSVARIFVKIDPGDQEELCRELGAGRGALCLLLWIRLNLEAFRQQTSRVAVSLNFLAFTTGISRARVPEYIRDLQRLGFVEIHRQTRPTPAGRQEPVATAYQLKRGAYSGSACEAPPSACEFVDNGNCQAPHLQETQEVQESPSVPPRGATGGDRPSFKRQAEELYALYPRHEGRKAAIKAIAKALADQPFDALKEAVTTYAESQRGRELTYIPHPATWFNQGRWADDRAAWTAWHEHGHRPADDPATESMLAAVSRLESQP
jgi:hypothetical protein